MLARHVIGYLPSLVIPAITSFAAIYCYTRLLAPAEYGHYALALSMMNLLNAVFFYWLQVSLPRLMPQARREEKALHLRSTIYAAFIAASLLMTLILCLFISTLSLGDLTPIAWLVIPLAIMRSALTLNQTFYKSVLNFNRYNLLECGQALLGLSAGLFLIWAWHRGSSGAVLGLILGMACMLLIDTRQWRGLSAKYINRDTLKEIMHFGLPLTFTYGLAFIISSSDRFLIDHFRGAGEVGIYAAGYSLTDRIMAMTFMMVSLPSYPLTVHKLEHEGIEAARQQTHDNGIMLLMLPLPLLAGLILAKNTLAAVVIGSQFRDGTLHVIPWIAAGAFLNGFATHYFDHAFYLAKKPSYLFLTQGPAALINLILNITLIPRYGYMGAAYASTASYIVLLLLSIVVGKRAFPVAFPFAAAWRIATSVLGMVAVIMIISFPATLTGLAAMTATGMIAYAAGLIAFNVMGVRSKLLNSFK